MMRLTRKIILMASLFVLFFFTLFLINQTAQIVTLAQNVNPGFGKVALWGLLSLYLLMVVIPAYLYFRLPQALFPPENSASPEYRDYLSRLSRRLKRNVHLKSVSLETHSDIEVAFKKLSEVADRLINKNASVVFVSTAISQSGRLDAFTVLLAQIRMVWNVAMVYYQRPALREMIQLYANVAATAFIAEELNEIDVSRQIEPIITSVMGTSLSASVPGMSKIAGIVTNSLITGAANAYLTLRVGAIAKSYCSSLTRKEKGFIRRSASLEAARMLSKIVMTSTANISKAFMAATVKTPGRFSRDIITSTWGKISSKRPKTKPSDEET
ncbi:MAG: DUF697 domain-containing protein [Candidatus Aminicenantes bacterium]|nr:DUF697 domain-containing protein [Candidatus Aminicenantes bacterium]